MKRLVAVDGPHISIWAAVIASLTRVGEAESHDERRRTRRLDRRIRKVRAWIQNEGFTAAQLEEFAAGAVVAFLEENRDRKLEVQSSYADYIRASEMDKAGAWLAYQIDERKQRLRAGGIKRQANNPSAISMQAIKKEWLRLQEPGQPYPGDAAFAKAQHAAHGASIKNDGSIKNAITRWRKELASSS